MPGPSARTFFLLVPLLLTGCRGLAGSWAGDLVCVGRDETVQGDAVMVLAGDGGGEFEGELRVEGEVSGTAGSGAAVWSWELELERTQPIGEQFLDHKLAACVLYLDGALSRQACPEGDMDWLWDGASGLSMTSPDCALELAR